jgi:hypothetical protein
MTDLCWASQVYAKKPEVSTESEPNPGLLTWRWSPYEISRITG